MFSKKNLICRFKHFVEIIQITINVVYKGREETMKVKLYYYLSLRLIVQGQNFILKYFGYDYFIINRDATHLKRKEER